MKGENGNGIKRLLEVSNATLNSINEAMVYYSKEEDDNKEYDEYTDNNITFFGDAYSNVADGIVNCLECILKNEEKNFENELSEAEFIAWQTSLDNVISLLAELKNNLEDSEVDTSKLSNIIEEYKLKYKKFDATFYNGNYKLALKNIREATEALCQTYKQCKANEINLRRNAKKEKFEKYTLVLWAPTILIYPTIVSAYNKKPLDEIVIVLLLFVLVMEYFIVKMMRFK